MSDDCYCDYDPPEIWRSAVHKARKEHQCEECCKKIQPGERYEYVWGIWDGYDSTFKTCERCLNLRQWVKNNIPCFCWAHGNMLDDAHQAIHEARHRAKEEMKGVTFGYLRMLYRVKREPRTSA